MKPLQTSAQQALRLQGRHRVIGVATLMLLVVTILPWLLAPSRAPRAASGADQESFPVSRAVSGRATPTRQLTTTPALALAQNGTGTVQNEAGPAPVAAVPLPEAEPSAADQKKPDAARQPPLPVVSDKPASPAPSSQAPSSQAPPSQASPSHPSSSSEQVAPAVVSDHVVVQVGVFSEQSKAHALLKKLESQGIHAHMQVLRYPQGTRVRVRIGPLKTRSELKKLRHQLDQMGIKSMIVAP